MIKIWLLETRPQFLILDIVLAILGTSVAAFEGYFNLSYALLGLLGLILIHISVNALNDYFDFKSGIDLVARRTPFSGGSGMIPAQKMKPCEVLCLGIVSFIMAVTVGVFFTLAKGWLLLPLLLIGALCVLFYTSLILKTPYPEWAAGLGLGLLPILGMYFIQTGFYSWDALIATVPSFILVYNLLFLNEFPDVEADRIGRRKTFPILLGKRAASINFTVMTVLMYLWVVIWIIAGVMPVFTLIVLLTVPLALKAIKGALNYEDINQLMSGMANNVLTVLLAQLLIGIGYILAILFA